MPAISPDILYSGRTFIRAAEHASAATGYVVAHCSDPHITCVGHSRRGDFFNKRMLGCLRWQLKRRREQHDGLLTILSQDLQRTQPDHIVITGDLTHLCLPAEFASARDWLQGLGPASQVTVIPGNHDQYVRTDWQQSFAFLLPFMQGDVSPLPTAAAVTGLEELFPTLRIRGHIALIGTSTARPSALHLATGRLGREQLNKLEVLLHQLAGQHLFRILLIHHPPLAGVVSRRRSLTDAPALQALIARHGVELVLFGHAHKSAQGALSGPAGPIPAMGVPSASSLVRSDERRARYVLYEIKRSAAEWVVRMEERIWAAVRQQFIAGQRREFVLPR